MVACSYVVGAVIRKTERSSTVRERRQEGNESSRESRCLLLSGPGVLVSVELWWYRARAEALAATGGFSGARAFRGLEELVKLGPRQPDSQGLEEARKYITRQLSAAAAEVQVEPFLGATPLGRYPDDQLHWNTSRRESCGCDG